MTEKFYKQSKFMTNGYHVNIKYNAHIITPKIAAVNIAAPALSRAVIGAYSIGLVLSSVFVPAALLPSLVPPVVAVKGELVFDTSSP